MPKLYTIKQLVLLPDYAWLSESILRRLIFESQEKFPKNNKVVSGNGLSKAGAIIRLGRKILIDKDRFDKWLEENRSG